MWLFSKKKDKETLLSKIQKLTKEGKEKSNKEKTVEKNIKDGIIAKAKEGKASLMEKIELDIKDEVLKLIQKEGFTAHLSNGYGWYIHINW